MNSLIYINIYIINKFFMNYLINSITQKFKPIIKTNKFYKLYD